MGRKLLSGILALCMLAGIFPPCALAAEEEEISLLEPSSFAGSTEERDAPIYMDSEEPVRPMSAAELRTYTAGYTVTHPKVTSLTVAYNNGTPVEFVNGGPLIKAVEGGKPRFTVVFDHPELVDKVYIAGTSGGAQKYLDAQKQADGTYVAEGYFDGDRSFVPQTVCVRCSEKVIPVSRDNDSAGDISLRAERAALSGQGMAVENITKDDGGVTATVVINKGAEETAQVAVDALIDEMPLTGTTKEMLEKWAGLSGVANGLDSLSEYTREGGFTFWVGEVDKIMEEAGKDPVKTVVVIARDVTGSKYTKLILESRFQKNDGGLYEDLAAHEFAMQALESYSSAAKTVLEVYNTQKEMEELRQEIRGKSTLSESQRSEALDKIDALEKDRQAFLAATMILPFVAGVTAATGGAAGLLFSGLLGVFTATSGYFWDYRAGQIRATGETRVFNVPIIEHPGWQELPSVLDPKDYVSDHLYFTKMSSFSAGAGDVYDLDLHGELASVSATDATVSISDCKYYEQKEDGTSARSRGSSAGVSGPNGKLTVDQADLATLSVSGEGSARLKEGVISNSGPTVCLGNGAFTIDGGTVYNRYTGSNNSVEQSAITNKNINDWSKITLNKGAILSEHDSIEMTSKKSVDIEVNGGQVQGDIFAASDYSTGRAEVTVSGGEVYGDIRLTQGAERTVTVEGGSVSGLVQAKKINFLGGTVGTAEGGAVYSESGTEVTVAGEDTVVLGNLMDCFRLNMTGGTVKGGVKSFCLTHLGGTVNGGISIGGSSLGEPVLIGGDAVVNGGLTYGSGKDLTLSGSAVVNGGINLTNAAGITVDGATITGGMEGRIKRLTVRDGTIRNQIEVNWSNAELVLSIGPGTDIVLDGAGAAVFASDRQNLAVAAEPGYTGGVMYYDSPTAAGRRMTIEQANSLIPFKTQTYVRLVADGQRPPADCIHAYRYTRTVEATCGEGGYTLYTCTKCGAEDRRNPTAALVHEYGNFSMTIAPTGSSYGLEERLCTNCFHSEKRVITSLNGTAITPTAPKVVSVEALNMGELTASGGFVNPQITVVNLGAAASVTAYAALYDSDGRLMGLGQTSLTIQPGQETYPLPESGLLRPSSGQGDLAEVRVFLVNGAQRPMCRAGTAR